MTDAGLILITSITNVDEYELDVLKRLNSPNRTLIINVGENRLADQQADLVLIENEDSGPAVKKIVDLLVKALVLDPEYFI